MTEKLLRRKQVLELCGISKATLYRMIKVNSFPQRYHLPGEKCVVWKLSEIELWMESLKRVP